MSLQLKSRGSGGYGDDNTSSGGYGVSLRLSFPYLAVRAHRPRRGILAQAATRYGLDPPYLGYRILIFKKVYCRREQERG